MKNYNQILSTKLQSQVSVKNMEDSKMTVVDGYKWTNEAEPAKCFFPGKKNW